MGCDVPSISFAELPGNPVPPSSGRLKLFVLASNHEFYVINSAGAVSLLSSYVLGPALQSIEALEPIPADRFLYTNGTNTFNESPITLLARQLMDDGTQGVMQSTLGLVIGTNVQAWSADLDSFVTNVSWTGANAVFGGDLGVAGTLSAVAGLVINGPAQFDSTINCDADVTASGTFNAPVFTLSSGPTITTGSGAPAAAEPDGSLYLRSGAPNGSLYVRQNGVWTLK